MTELTDDHDDTSAVEELFELRALAAQFEPAEITWEAPPAGLWDRIAAAVDEPANRGNGAGAAPQHESTDLRPGPAGAEVRPFGVPGRGRRPARGAGPQRTTPWLLAAAAAVAVVVLGGWWLRDAVVEPTVLAAAPLERLTDVGDGTAELVEADGSLRLRIDTEGLETAEGQFMEVWLIDTEVSRLVSLGPLREDGTYDLPAGLDPEAFPVVDVSREPIDGDPTHSGDSVLRGQLEF